MRKERNWEKVYIGQNEILKTLKNIDDIFLGGGTAVQRFAIKQQYRESEDLDFFMDSFDDVKNRKIISKINQTLSDNQLIKIENIANDKESGTYRLFCSIESLDERIKIELLNFTDGRYKNKSFLSNRCFPRVENSYNLILYKLKALCDRHDTMKDLFDLYFLFREYKSYPIDINQLFIDLNLKFNNSTGYTYNIKEVTDALNAPYRKWDIIIKKDFLLLSEDIKKAIDEFKKDFSIQINSNAKELDLSYEKRLVDKKISVPDDLFYDCLEGNNFIVKHVKSLA